MDQQAARRRPLLKAALGSAVAVGAVGGTVRWWPEDQQEGSGRSALVLTGDDSGQVSEVVVDLEGPRLSRSSGLSRWQTAQLSASVYSMVGLTWDDPRAMPAIEIRTRSAGRWADWRAVSVLHDLPDQASSEAASRGGSDLVWVGRSDGVQVRSAGPRPAGLRLVLLQPWALPSDVSSDQDGDASGDLPGAVSGELSGDMSGDLSGDLSGDRVVVAALARSAVTDTAQVPRPTIRSRRRWGAQESWRDGQPSYNRTIQQVHVHHTAGSNSYTRREVPAILRGIYRYHTHYMGWSDIGYNFLVDRFGRIWVGRAGGARRPVRGAHTLGFNATSTGVSVIGNFDIARPSSAVVSAVAALAAWKLRRYGRDPLGLARVWSEGSDKYAPGRFVTLPVIDGHRNTNDTACPGGRLYRQLPEIRRRAAQLIEYYSKVHVVERPEMTGVPALGRTLSVGGGRYYPPRVWLSYTWLRDGKPIPLAGRATYTVRPADAGHRISVRVVARKRGLEPVRRTVWSSARVLAPSTVSVNPNPRGDGRLRVDVRVTSPKGVVMPRGQVVVRVAGRRRVIRLVDGHGVAKFGWSTPLEPGRYRVRARYLGDRAHHGNRDSARTRVRR